MLIITAFLSLLLGFVVYLNNPKKNVNRLYLLFTISSSLWLFANAVATDSSNLIVFSSDIQLIFAKLISPLSLITLLFLYLYLLEFLQKPKNKYIIFSLIIAVIITSLLAFSSIGVQRNPITDDITIGSFYAVYLLLLVSEIVIVGITLYGKDEQIEINDKKWTQRSFLRNGLALTIIPAFIFGAILPAISGNSWIIDAAPLFAIVFITFAAVAMIKHSLFDIRPLIVRTLSYVTSIFILTVIFIATMVYIGRFLTFGNMQISDLIVITLIMVFFALLFQPIKKRFDKLSNSIFYRDIYEPQTVINSINSVLVNTLDLEVILQNTSNILQKELKIKFVEFYLEPKESIQYHLVGSNKKLFSDKNWPTFSTKFIELKSKKVLYRTEDDDYTELTELMKSLDIEITINMISNGENVGLLIIGPRLSGAPFSQQDVQLLEIIADEVAIAVQNALRFEEISKFTVTLQKKIDEATAELQKTNEKLRTLDEAKDEFISMASHQLRTPLTSIKGYISMILEGDAGEINEQQQNFLNQAFISSQRMVYLIADLLNVSRLKTGKFMIETQDVYLPDVVATEVDQLVTTSEARGLNLKYKKPKTFPVLQLDETKTRQVVMNFIDNAIYYTPKGGTITLELKTTDKLAQLTVTDNGIGVPKHEQHQLFTKFYRAGNAKKARPDGTGLGLFMAKKVIVAQGGTIIFKSTEGKGSTFGFSFPLPELS